METLNVKENLKITKNRILEAEVLATAIHFVQIERGLSVGFVVSNGKNNSDKLLSIRQKVDSALEDIKKVYASTHGDTSVLSSLSDLSEKRASVDSLSINAPDTNAYFTKNIKTFLDVALIIPPLIDDKDGRNIIQAYTHLATSKEALGQIRANLNSAFSKNSFVEDTFFKFGGSLGAYNVNLGKFDVLASDKVKRFYRDTYKGESVDKITAMMDIARSKGMSGGFGVEPSVWFNEATTSIDLLRDIELELYKDVLKLADLKIEKTNSDIAVLLLSLVIVLLLFFISVIIIFKNITDSIKNIQAGLFSFFTFLNQKTDKAESINLDSKDEFGQMAKVINENISSIEKGLLADANTVANAVETANKVKAGYLNVQITVLPNNPQLVELRNVLNEMLVGLNANIEKSLNTLKIYATNNFTSRADKASLEGEVASLIDGINNLGNEISTMLSSSLTNGLDLQTEASTLKQSVELLLTSSNQQAASLEETAAAMEEMTSNVQNNVAKSNDMALMATQTDSAAREGAVLASRTASAMTEIQSATNSINDAVAIIENIAFQTNILSLNAAVEAATAGDAGKGFAVVAQEVRNLANRSADAAKEIKAMASQAANKSNEGMNIATELTRGFEVIADKIAQTASMVQDVSNANREQMQGIGQINTAVTQLDQMTQENAKVAAQADSIANATISKAEAMVQDALSKEFVGKSNIRATQSSTTGINATRTSKPVQAAKPVVSKQKYASNAIAKNSSKHESDVWESF
ncbi:nitrate- and nitrite sensing domain-containing protein [Sulfurimonas sp. RIFOXYB12_FULL_35_9]|uniref:methyl-accepting chemotaxis protein n=1 Tax=Sulfurimonas sp. RIFOXYB12_FULL_35_9 TaxID=1802256 RepID=UPI0008C00636|nr:nitrate- and nitrite sensing domain-containing protein [Sulfurimonas sp. RIFOXYB12_FULL_35_9]OHE06576.1 MAG: hypothetical protein A2345_01935 [Sulfurimonas sp. RIFOXYB12_FULL_35_9]